MTPNLCQDNGTLLIAVTNMKSPAECRHIALGKVIMAIDPYFERIEDENEVIEFIRRQTAKQGMPQGRKLSSS
jgi:hypothetical protein